MQKTCRVNDVYRFVGKLAQTLSRVTADASFLLTQVFCPLEMVAVKKQPASKVMKKKKPAAKNAKKKPSTKRAPKLKKLVVNGKKLTLPSWMSVSEALEESMLELPCMKLDKIYVPCTRIEQHCGIAPRVMSRVLGMSVKLGWSEDRKNCGWLANHNKEHTRVLPAAIVDQLTIPN